METTHLVSILTDLRKTAEAEAEMPATEIEVTLAAALDDVCRALYLGPGQTRQVMGAEAFAAIYSHTPMTLPDDQWAELHEKVRGVYSKSQNVVIAPDRAGDGPGPNDPAMAFQEAFCAEG